MNKKAENIATLGKGSGDGQNVDLAGEKKVSMSAFDERTAVTPSEERKKDEKGGNGFAAYRVTFPCNSTVRYDKGIFLMASDLESLELRPTIGYYPENHRFYCCLCCWSCK